jgi:hypothetical protein
VSPERVVELATRYRLDSAFERLLNALPRLSAGT